MRSTTNTDARVHNNLFFSDHSCNPGFITGKHSFIVPAYNEHVAFFRELFESIKLDGHRPPRGHFRRRPPGSHGKRRTPHNRIPFVLGGPRRTLANRHSAAALHDVHPTNSDCNPLQRFQRIGCHGALSLPPNKFRLYSSSNVL